MAAVVEGDLSGKSPGFGKDVSVDRGRQRRLKTSVALTEYAVSTFRLSLSRPSMLQRLTEAGAKRNPTEVMTRKLPNETTARDL